MFTLRYNVIVILVLMAISSLFSAGDDTTQPISKIRLPVEFYDWNAGDLGDAFQFDSNCGLKGKPTKGLVGHSLNDERLPVPGNTGEQYNCRAERLTEWFRPEPDSSNYTCIDLELNHNDHDNVYEYVALTEMYDIHNGVYDNMNEQSGFFPLDGFWEASNGRHNNKNQIGQNYSSRHDERQTKTGYVHNYHYCMKTELTFDYRPGQQFTFNGDDDLWIFIDGQLAVDLGGTHTPISETLHLDQLFNERGGAVAGSNHDFDLFYCERQTLASNLQIQTDIDFDMPPEYGHITNDDIHYDIVPGKSLGNGCHVKGEVIVKESEFYLSYDNSLNLSTVATTLTTSKDMQLLQGNDYFEGISIDNNTYQFSIELGKLEGLEIGHTYYLFYRSESSTESTEYRGSVSFTAPDRYPYEIVFTDSLGAPLSDDDIYSRVDSAVVLYGTVYDYDYDSTRIVCESCNDIITVSIAEGKDTQLEFFNGTMSEGRFSLTVLPSESEMSVDDLRLTVEYSGQGTRINKEQRALSPKLTFTKIPTPSIESVRLFDSGVVTKGAQVSPVKDGYADSLVVVFNNWLGSPKKLTLCLGVSDKECVETEYDADDWSIDPTNSAQLVIVDAFDFGTDNVATDIQGEVTVEFFKRGDHLFEDSEEIEDEIGPVIDRAYLKKDGDDEVDTLRVIFSEPVSKVVAQEALFLVEGASVTATDTESYTKKRVWDIAIDAEKYSLAVGDSIALDHHSDMVDLKGNGPAQPNMPRVIGGWPVQPVKEGHYFRDTNEDGIMDRVELLFNDVIIGDNIAEVTAHFKWINSDDSILSFKVKPSQWHPDPDDERRAYWNLSDDIDCRPFTTSIVDETFMEAKIEVESLTEEEDVEYTIEMQDGMAPVLVSAEVFQRSEGDVLKVVLSEHVENSDLKKEGTEHYWFKHRYADAEHHQLRAEGSSITHVGEKSEHGLNYDPSIKKEFQISPGDSLSLVLGRGYTVDMHGNRPSDHAQSIMITGNVTPHIGSVTLKEYDDPDEVLERFYDRDNTPFVMRGITPDDPNDSMDDVIEYARENFDEVGMVVSANMMDMVLSQIDEDLLKEIEGGALKKELSIRYDIIVYSTIGGYVSSSNGSIECDDDALFEGDCTDPEKAHWLWIGWDPVSDQGRLVGTGVYIALLDIQYLYPGGATPVSSSIKRMGYSRKY
ncbi:MAG: fibro-slime domain-containing protein [Fibrobacterales bacterium]